MHTLIFVYISASGFLAGQSVCEVFVYLCESLFNLRDDPLMC